MLIHGDKDFYKMSFYIRVYQYISLALFVMQISKFFQNKSRGNYKSLILSFTYLVVRDRAKFSNIFALFPMVFHFPESNKYESVSFFLRAQQHTYVLRITSSCTALAAAEQ